MTNTRMKTITILAMVAVLFIFSACGSDNGNELSLVDADPAQEHPVCVS